MKYLTVSGNEYDTFLFTFIDLLKYVDKVYVFVIFDIVMEQINLSSDTVTKPTKEMLEFMMSAEVGDDVMRADPTVIALEEKVAGMFERDAALFFPTGTMANQSAIKIHTQPGDQFICHEWAHVFNFEGGAAAWLSSISSRLVKGDRGMYTADQLKDALNDPDDVHLPLSRLVAVENTTNKGGGACWDIEELRRIRTFCSQHDLKLHLDGARLFNALVRRGEKPKMYGEIFDTISICLSKGLGAPVGSVLIGSNDVINRARRIRKALGGGMRQAGYLAAAGIYALDNNVERLKTDHEHAQQLVWALDRCNMVERVEPVETNIVIFYIDKQYSEADFVKRLDDENIIISNMGNGKLRMVTHLDITPDMIERVTDVLKNM
ncbi:MAG: aminotransferase class I/II-fold pyridoxal phosphate-dependent enzyme [Bacteroidales bacterium]|nr:aminotransferase class I/II-fold pyridoxal phosphate-dependent enzyme [Bacteroidales bacterium]